MSSYDEVEGILDPYGSQFKLWDCEMKVLKSGDTVPNVGMADTYAVQLDTYDEAAKPCFLWVQQGKITNLMALQPIAEKAVFDKWGKCLGRGGEKLAAPGPNPVKQAVGILNEVIEGTKEVVNQKADEIIEDLAQATEKLKEELGEDYERTETITHRFQLRHDYTVKLKLPEDLTDREAERIALFVQALPFERPE